MTAWPATLPRPRQVDFRGTTNLGGLRQDMDAGPAYQRPRYTAVPESFSVSFVMDRTQYTTFRAFWMNDLQQGTQSFSWENPETQLPATCQFDCSQGFSRTAEAGWFTVTATLWVLP